MSAFRQVSQFNRLKPAMVRVLLGSPLLLMINQQLGAFRISFCLKNGVARRCKPVTAISTLYRRLQTVPRNTSATRPFLLRSRWNSTWRRSCLFSS
jgi:hypothetical protein